MYSKHVVKRWLFSLHVVTLSNFLSWVHVAVKSLHMQKMTMQIYGESPWRDSKHRMLILTWEVPEMQLTKGCES